MAGTPSPSRKRPREEEAYPAFRCEPCGLDLESAVALESHKKSHVKCNACEFQGVPKVVKGHYQAVHGKFSGQGFKTVTVAIPGCPVQRFRICVGNRPEDVQKWIAERKKKFPRSARPAQTPQAIENKPSTQKDGLASLLEGYSSSEDEQQQQETMDAKPAMQDTCGVTKQESPPEEEVQPSQSLPSPQTKPCHSFVRLGRCRRGNACPYSHDESLRKPSNHGQKQSNPKKGLLSSLLESDVDREAKLSLQLIHYLVHSEFLKKRI